MKMNLFENFGFSVLPACAGAALAAAVFAVVAAAPAGAQEAQQISLTLLADKPQAEHLAAALNLPETQAAAAIGENAQRAESAGADGGGPTWADWAAGNWGWLEGAPQVDGGRFAYKGKNYGVYGGVERLFAGSGIEGRIGLAAGRSRTKLRVNAGGGADNFVERRLFSLLPYVELRGGALALRVVGGAGKGETQVQGMGGDGGGGGESCAADLDTDWRYAGVSGKMDLGGSGGWRNALSGDFSRSGSTMEAGGCGAASDISGENGEWALGWHLGYTREEGEPGGFVGLFAPVFGLVARRPFTGDVHDDDVAYDAVGAVRFGMEGRGLSFNLDGKTQLNDTSHRRDSVGGGARWQGGGVVASLRVAAGAGGGLLRRLELNYADARGRGAMEAGMYVEGGGGAGETAAGGEIRVGF